VRLWQTFGVGAGLAVLPLVAGLTYSADRLQHLAEQNERLMLRQLAAVRLGTGVAARLERLGEYQRKYAVVQDQRYAMKARETAAAIDHELARLHSDDLGVDDAPVVAFAARWVEWHARGLDDEGAVLIVDELSSSARDLLSRAADAAAKDADDAKEARSASARAAVIATALALTSSVTVIVLLARRLRRRLDEVVRATDAVSRGAFSTQMRGVDDDDELGRVAGAFNRMVTALDQLERMKADFLSSISHELKTPLVAMVETNAALLDEIAGPLSPKQRRMIELNRAAATRLGSMISDLLELSVVRASVRYDVVAGDLAVLTRDAVSELEARAVDRRQTVTVTVAPLQALRDPDRFVQVVQNLVENAIKYTPEGGHIAVRLEEGVDEVIGPCAILSVDDDGPGIPVDERARIFEKFFRRRGVSSAGGSGLGLAIVQEIITAHRGRVFCRDGVLGGGGFSVCWPLTS
jgi:two-component system sensor histidine kinase GlrK